MEKAIHYQYKASLVCLDFHLARENQFERERLKFMPKACVELVLEFHPVKCKKFQLIEMQVLNNDNGFREGQISGRLSFYMESRRLY